MLEISLFLKRLSVFRSRFLVFLSLNFKVEETIKGQFYVDNPNFKIIPGQLMTVKVIYDETEVERPLQMKAVTRQEL